MHTTLNRIRAYGPCLTSWERGLALLGKTKPDDEPIPIIAILDAMGLGDALWCLRAVEGRDRDIRLLAVAFASKVRHLMPDPRSHRVLEVAVAVANGLATKEELREAMAAALDATWADDAAATYAAYAAYAAATTYGAVVVAAYYAARAAANAAGGVGRRAAQYAMRARQAKILREFCQRAAQEGKA